MLLYATLFRQQLFQTGESSNHNTCLANVASFGTWTWLLPRGTLFTGTIKLCYPFPANDSRFTDLVKRTQPFFFFSSSRTK